MKGKVWDNVARIGNPIASFDDGKIWTENGFCVGSWQGSYRNGEIWNNCAACGVNKAFCKNGKIWFKVSDIGNPDASYSDGRIWDNGFQIGNPVFSYEGDDEGAAATFALLKNRW